MGILLDALTAQGFLDKQDGKYQTRPAIQRLLSANSPDNILPMVQHAAGLWKRWSQLTDIIQGKAAPDQENDEGSTLLQNLVKAMHVVNAAKAPAVIHQIQPGHARRLLDVGGGWLLYCGIPAGGARDAGHAL
ncbi:MAG: hypothetical protein HZT40_09185 [Candidatus Thiothrix singaporensis]|uniref:Uncharacterized protein n=1 Tax=Candidatus Thiothrix singaporensis TaxID=2799669 RepID=A0A7L6ARK7_9GAMM|nr:MAG: hypothetical protein HZT40_09185 [Candidatus Thiothrix singaporensis]